MQKIKKYLVRIVIILCLTFVATPEFAVVSTNSVVIAQAAYNTSTIKQVQHKLNNLGYNCGKADGSIGKKTKAAIKKYQKDHDLKATGSINRTLLKSLNIKSTSSSASIKKETIVYVTESGTKYHRSGCRYLWHSSIAMEKSEAEKYYSPCSICNP